VKTGEVLGAEALPDVTAPQFISLFLAYLKNSFLNGLAYRFQYFMSVISTLIFVAVNFFIWRAVYHGVEAGAEVRGYSFAEITTYIVIGWLSIRFCSSGIDSSLNSMVRSGQISLSLIRPVDLQLRLTMRALSESCFTFLFVMPPLSFFLWIMFPILLPYDLSCFLFYIVSIILGFFTLALLNFIVGLSAFYLFSINGLISAKHFLIQILSGLLLPLEFFPGFLRVIMEFLPFKNIIYVPVLIYLGKVSREDVSSLILSQLFWIIALLLIGRLFWRHALQKLEVQGG